MMWRAVSLVCILCLNACGMGLTDPEFERQYEAMPWEKLYSADANTRLRALRILCTSPKLRDSHPIWLADAISDPDPRVRSLAHREATRLVTQARVDQECDRFTRSDQLAPNIHVFRLGGALGLDASCAWRPLNLTAARGADDDPDRRHRRSEAILVLSEAGYPPEAGHVEHLARTLSPYSGQFGGSRDIVTALHALRAIGPAAHNALPAIEGILQDSPQSHWAQFSWIAARARASILTADAVRR